jgi:hypothetical protein
MPLKAVRMKGAIVAVLDDELERMETFRLFFSIEDVLRCRQSVYRYKAEMMNWREWRL